MSQKGPALSSLALSHPNGSKGFAPFLIVLILAVVVSVGGFLIWSNYSNNRTKITPQPIQVIQPSSAPAQVNQTTPTPNPIANWKTYKQDEVWEIKYPENWLIPEGAITTSSVGFSDGKDVPRGPSVGYIYVQVAWGSTSSYDKLLAKEVGTIEKGAKLTTTVLEKLTIGRFPAVKLREETTSGASTEYSYEIAVYVKGPINVRISALSLKDKDVFTKTYLPIFNQILSTFKFLP